jgi:hypothetical protein
MVFGYGQFHDGRKILLEWNDVEAMRTVFVKKFRELDAVTKLTFITG